MLWKEREELLREGLPEWSSSDEVMKEVSFRKQLLDRGLLLVLRGSYAEERKLMWAWVVVGTRPWSEWWE